MTQKLSDASILQIWGDKRSAKTIAQEHGCSRSTVYSIRSGLRRQKLTLGANPSRPAGKVDYFSKVWQDAELTRQIKNNQSIGALRRWQKLKASK